MKLKKTLSKIAQCTIPIIMPLVTAYGTWQLCYLVKDIIDSLTLSKQSKQRQEFKQEFGVYIKGSETDIEEKAENLSKLAYVLQREKKEMPLGLKSVIIEPNDYLDEIKITEPGEKTCTLNPIGLQGDKWIKLSSIGFDCEGAQTHEVKHSKAKLIAKKHPEFLKKWENLSKDSSGKSLYFGNNYSEHDNFKEFGFITQYAGRNVDEDIAELGEIAETNPYGLISVFDEKNQKIIDKLDLAMEYGIIPKEFLEYLELSKINETKNATSFLEKSEEFLRKYPNTIYQSEIKYRRGNALSWDAYFSSDLTGPIDEAKLKKAREEYMGVLTSPFKDMKSYKETLDKLCSYYLTNEWEAGKYKKFEDASKEYDVRFKKGNIKLATIGVNDYLIAQGENLGENENDKK